MAYDGDFAQLLHSVTETLPNTWMPRREQPEYDRMFSGRMEIEAEFRQGSDKAVQWLTEANAFSAVVKDGFSEADDDLDLATFGQVARGWVAKGQHQGLGE